MALDWAHTARTGAAADVAYAALDGAARRAAVVQGLRLVTGKPADVVGAERICRAMLELMRRHGPDDTLLRCNVLAGLAGIVARQGRDDEAIPLFRDVLAETGPETELIRSQCAIYLSIMLPDSDEGAALVRPWIARLRELGHHDLAARAATNYAIIIGDRDPAEALAAARDALDRGGGDSEIVAKLEAAAGRALGFSLGRPAEAVPYYQRACDGLERAGLSDEAAECRTKLVATALLAGQHDLARDVFVAIVCPDKRSARAMIELLGAHVGPAVEAGDATAWVPPIERLLHQIDGPFRDLVRAGVLAVLAVACAVTGEHARALALVEDPAFPVLHLSFPARTGGDALAPLRGLVTRAVERAGRATGRSGARWRLGWLHRALDPEELVQLRWRHDQELAAVWLAARLDGASGSSDRPPVALAAVGPEAPPWLGLDAAQSAAYGRAHASLCGAVDHAAVVQAAYQSAARHGDGGDHPAAIEAAASALPSADLWGHPIRRGDLRIRVADSLQHLPGGLTAERFAEARRHLDEARAALEGTPGEILAVYNLGVLLSNGDFGDEVTRLGEAVAYLRRGQQLTTRWNQHQFTPALVHGLALAMLKHPSAGPAGAAEAIRLLTPVLEACEATPGVEPTYLASVHNTLGLAFLHSQPAQPEAALMHFQAAFIMRRSDGTPQEVAHFLGNMMSAALKADTLDHAMLVQVVDNWLDNARKKIASLDDPLLTQRVLIAVAKVMSRVGDARALECAQMAIVAVRSLGVTSQLAHTCADAARLHIEAQSWESAERLCDEGLAAVEALRASSTGSADRAHLTKSFTELHRDKRVCQRARGASAADRWWTLERNTSRTVLAQGRGGGRSDGDREEVLAALLHLPDDTLLVHLDDSASELAWFTIRRRAGSLELAEHVSDARFSDYLAARGARRTGEMYTIDLQDPQTRRRRVPTVAGGDRGPDALDGELDTIEGPAAWLSKQVIARLDLDASVRRVAFISQGHLNDAPWNLSRLVTGERLAARCEIVASPSGTLLARGLQRPRRRLERAVLVACDPTRELSEIVEEIDAVLARSNFQERVILTDTRAPVSREAVLAHIAGADLVHFAGHGTHVAGSPDKTGIHLFDGVLTPHDIITACGNSAPAVVFLSACQTSVRQPSYDDAPTPAVELVALGTRAFIGTRWPVRDDVARLVAESFYGALAARGAVTALAEAQRAGLAMAHDNEDAIQWASYIVTGWD